MSENIWLAIAEDNFETVKDFIETKKYTANSKDDNGYSPMHAAASYKNLDMLMYLINNKGDPRITDNDGDTPLHFCEEIECAKLLIESGADPKALNNEGKTESLTKIMNYIVANSKDLDLNDEDAIKSLVSQYLLDNIGPSEEKKD
ncbi:hypothetical protein BB560_000748 [Smittium megazygosporum]|uniref:Uncharacterized protein n=1 Tax=Smittium megazygosporum TaxID=133381 RepID=A0A2T9ZJF6_9FUNG|nr:hypothetical protein BB560_000748 [Smittium megazygosporum]